MTALAAFTLYQIASLLGVLSVVFLGDQNAWWLLLHPIATIWYIVITSTFLKS